MADKRQAGDGALEGEERPTVSVVIPAHNSAGTIQTALDSVYGQSSSDIIEVIVVDDGSTDDTAHLVTAGFPHVRCVRQENAGASAARNRGAEMARGDYIAFLDADDEWFPEKIAAQLEVAWMHPGLALVLCDTQPVLGREKHGPNRGVATRGVTRGERGRQGMVVTPVTFADLVMSRTRFFPGCSVWLLRKEAFMAVGRFDTNMMRAEELEYLWRLAWLGHGIAVVRTPLAVYCEDPKRRVSPKLMLAWAQAMKEMADRYLRPMMASGCDWLRADDAMALVKSRYRSTAEAFFLSGREAEAMALLNEARALPGGDVLTGLRILAALGLPRVFFGFRALALRFWMR